MDHELLDEWTLKGMHQKAIEVAIRLLERRFGAPPPELRHAIEQMPDAKLDELTDAILDFGSMSDAQAWIERHR